MVRVEVSWRHAAGLQRFAGMLEALGSKRASSVLARAVNRTGDMAKTQVTRALTGQTGLKRRVIVKAIGRPKRATGTSLAFIMETAGGDIALKHFRARETRAGVVAHSFGKRALVAGAFTRGGLFPARVPVARFGGHVFRRVGSGRLPIAKVKSGVIIPAEMVKGATAEAFTQTVRAQLPRRLEHELRRIAGGVLG